MRVVRQLQPELRTHELHQLTSRLLCLDLGIALVACEPCRDDALVPRCAVEDRLQNRWRLGRRRVRRCTREVLIGHTLRRKHLIDDAVGVSLAQNIACKPLQLRLIAVASLFQFHQNRAVAITLTAGQVNDHALGWRIPAYEGLHDRAKLKHRAVIFREPRRSAADSHRHRLVGRPSATAQFSDKRREFAANVVPDNDLLGFEPLGELLCDIVVQGVHQLRPPLSTLDSS